MSVGGIAGIVGAGRTEVVRAIAGADPHSSGTVSVNGKVLGHGLRDAIKAGIVLVPEDRKQQGLIVGETVEVSLSTCTDGNQLIHFAIRLFRQLQLVGSVPAVDMTRYEEHILPATTTSD